MKVGQGIECPGGSTSGSGVSVKIAGGCGNRRQDGNSQENM